MEDILRPIYQERASHKNTLGVIIVEKKGEAVSSITDTFDVVLLVIIKDSEQSVQIKHYEFNHNKAALHIVDENQLNEWVLLGSNRKVTEWLMNGRVLFDRNEYIHNLKNELEMFPRDYRKLKMGVEFAKLIRRYLEGKKFYESRQYLDAYNYVVHALHHLARLAVIENGFHPEVLVWGQVKQIEPEIYKLYEKLIEGEETLEKNLELLFLASDFLISSKIELGSEHLLEILSSKDEPWTYEDIMNHSQLTHYSIDLSIMIEFLIERGYIHVHKVETKGQHIYHRCYSVESN
ncbi:nucleotidyltransferase-like protein [Bacillus sp. SCS-151]|uniref:nucleotidyltransferase-like protein n=1 Tax=Nanhaiella sioensis TaxID=3115293 RepID=UPI00397A1DD9